MVPVSNGFLNGQGDNSLHFLLGASVVPLFVTQCECISFTKYCRFSIVTAPRSNISHAFYFHLY